MDATDDVFAPVERQALIWSDEERIAAEGRTITCVALLCYHRQDAETVISWPATIEPAQTESAGAHAVLNRFTYDAAMERCLSASPRMQRQPGMGRVLPGRRT